MTVPLTQRTHSFATAPQISLSDMPEIAAQGYKTVINNRPDGEGGPDQPLSADIAKAAAQCGIDYIYLPVISGQITEAQVAKFAELLATKPGPILAFCRSGARSMNIYQMATTTN